MSKVSEIFGENVFSETVMRDKLPKEVYKSLKKTIENGEPLDIELANVVAHAMKEWALERGTEKKTPPAGGEVENKRKLISRVARYNRNHGKWP